ncbi:hypothetical protein [Bradyrhizobium sp. McL0616]|uniref:hypothetical protein n=1 Tax=Bradyrhizobium sp. McL0616 TaxID=3415674 RepID=UPI003CF332D3
MKPTKRKRIEPTRPSFREVAALVTPNVPPWLPAFLEWWAQGIQHDRMADEIRPSRAKTAEMLSEIEDALALARSNLNNPDIRNLIEATENRSPPLGALIAAVQDLSKRTSRARSSSIVAGKDGKTKRGRGKPKTPNIFDAKTLCAARILELGRFLNKFEPGIRSPSAAKAAQAYWLASGGSSDGAGDPINGWKHHFKLAKENAESIGLKRLIWWRDLEQCQRRGRPSWFLGTEYPPQ